MEQTEDLKLNTLKYQNYESYLNELNRKYHRAGELTPPDKESFVGFFMSGVVICTVLVGMFTGRFSYCVTTMLVGITILQLYLNDSSVRRRMYLKEVPLIERMLDLPSSTLVKWKMNNHYITPQFGVSPKCYNLIPIYYIPVGGIISITLLVFDLAILILDIQRLIIPINIISIVAMLPLIVYTAAMWERECNSVPDVTDDLMMVALKELLSQPEIYLIYKKDTIKRIYKEIYKSDLEDDDLLNIKDIRKIRNELYSMVIQSDELSLDILNKIKSR